MFILQPGRGLGFTGSREIALALGATETVIELPPEFTPEPVHPPGMRRRQIMEEDEAILAIIIAFLETKD
jgi:hypothetical protein